MRQQSLRRQRSIYPAGATQEQIERIRSRRDREAGNDEVVEPEEMEPEDMGPAEDYDYSFISSDSYVRPVRQPKRQPLIYYFELSFNITLVLTYLLAYNLRNSGSTKD